jgi:hypothetical protein
MQTRLANYVGSQVGNHGACLGNDSFLRHQEINEAKAVDLGLESSHTAQLLGTLLKSKGKRWRGTRGELLHALRLTQRHNDSAGSAFARS